MNRREPVAVSAAAVRAHQRQHGQAAEGAVGLLVVGVGVVARDAEQHRRHAEGQGDVARRPVPGLDEIHVAGRQPHRLPVEPALQQHRPPGFGAPRNSPPRAPPSAAHTAPASDCLRPWAGKPARPTAGRNCRTAPCSSSSPHCADPAPSAPPRAAQSQGDRRADETASGAAARGPASGSPRSAPPSARLVVVGHRPAVRPLDHPHPVGPQQMQPGDARRQRPA